MACFKERKKIQRKFNKSIKALNKAIENDDFWRGRFVARQVNYIYAEDNCDGEIIPYANFYVGLTDKANNITEILIFSVDMYLPTWVLDYRLFESMNEFIIKIAKAWETEPDPRTDKTDYRKIKV